MKTPRLSFLLLPLLFSVTGLYGQENCDQVLGNAEDAFSAGHFYSIPGMLKECLESGNLATAQKVKAYMLLCQAYLIIDDPTAAEDSYLRLLKADPEFVPNEVEHPIDIVYLSKKFTATPVFTPHFRVGANTSFLPSILSVSTQPYPVSTTNNFRMGFQLGAGIDWNVMENIAVCGELNFALKGYKQTTTGIAGGDVQSVTANQFWMDLPLYVKYTYEWKPKMRIFGYGGYALNYLLSAKNDYLYTDNKPQGGTQVVAEGPSQTVNYLKSLNHSVVFGGGLKYKQGHDFIYVDIRYMAGLNNAVDVDKMYYANSSSIDKQQIGDPNYYLSNNVTRYRYVPDLYRLDNFSISFGYVHPLYNPRKVKKARTRGVAKLIQKREKGGEKK